MRVKHSSWEWEADLIKIFDLPDNPGVVVAGPPPFGQYCLVAITKDTGGWGKTPRFEVVQLRDLIPIGKMLVEEIV